MREASLALWETQLDALAGDELLQKLVAETTWRSGLTDRAMMRVLSLVRTNQIPIAQLRLFALGGVIADVSATVLQDLIDILIDQMGGTGPSIALEISVHYAGRQKTLDHLGVDRTVRLLLHDAFFTTRGPNRDSMVDYYWNELAEALLIADPHIALKVGAKLFEHFGERGTLAAGLHYRPSAFLTRCLQTFPSEIWKLAASYLGPPIDNRAFAIRNWLRGGISEGTTLVPIERIPPADLWNWVDEDVNSRAWYLAGIIPNSLFVDANRPCLAREILMRYGDRKDVQNSLMMSFGTEVWMGPASVHYETKVRALTDFLKDDQAPVVRKWVGRYIASLSNSVKQERVHEERRGF
jgi:hypothetical protein